jgi:hypothetical protein
MISRQQRPIANDVRNRNNPAEEAITLLTPKASNAIPSEIAIAKRGGSRWERRRRGNVIQPVVAWVSNPCKVRRQSIKRLASRTDRSEAIFFAKRRALRFSLLPIEQLSDMAEPLARVGKPCHDWGVILHIDRDPNG